MNHKEPAVRNISDTARWTAVFRGWENRRPDALFRDPYAERLAGERGAQIARELRFGTRHTWSWIARTYLVDRMIAEEVQQGTDMIVNLAAGLDTRPYRMELPSSLRWIEVDLSGILDYKEEILVSEKPVCGLERIRLDLSDANGRRETFERLGHGTKRVLIISEGLIVYLAREEVASFAKDLAKPPGFQRWLLDLPSPALLRLMQRRMGAHLEQAGAPLKFAPEEGPEYFVPFGWKPIQIHSLLHTAARLRRLPFWMRPFAFFPDTFPAQGKRPWSGVCLFGRQ
jgi:methyltransferase (TIGR00027 family)